MEHRKHLQKDKLLGAILKLQPTVTLAQQNQLHLALCSSIISQQLSTKVAKVIYARFLALFKTKTPTPKLILAVPFDTLRAIGLSNAKTNYVFNVCNFFVAHKLTDKKLHAMQDDELIELFIKIKGVGKWTIEMILMFAMGRPDVFAVDDLGIQQAMVKAYGLDATNMRSMKIDMVALAENWRPHRTYACRYLWHWKDSPVT